MTQIPPDASPLLDDPRARLMAAADPPPACHLVGGVIRDWLLSGAVSRDWDLVVAGGGEAFAERLTERASGRLVRPGGGRFAIFRVVSPTVRIDVWDRGETALEAELARRDFTVNSIAVDVRSGEIHDPLGGVADLGDRRLRANRPDSFDQDPLRVLRLLRFELTLDGFRTVSATAAAARRAAAKLSSVAAERVREELDRILSVRSAAGLGDRLHALDLHPRLWRPETSGGALPEPDLDGLDRLLGTAERTIGSPTEPGQLVVLRHAALVLTATTESPSAQPLLERGFVTRRDARHIDELLAAAESPPAGDAEERLFLHQAGRSWPLLATLAAWRADRAGRRAWSDTLPRLARLAKREGERIFDPPPLVRGDEIAARLDLEPGPELGRVVDRLRRLQVSGRIDTPEAAREWLRGAAADLPPPRQ